MTSPSARVATDRPFYARHAEAYDALVTDPVGPWVQAVHDRLVAAGLQPATILEAGCGTGRHAAALRELGHDVILLDASPALLDIARRRCPRAMSILGDLCDPDLVRHVGREVDAVTCRGVLNDLRTDAERDAACRSFARLLRSGGILLLDVREGDASQSRADGRWRTKSAQLPDGTRVRFHSRPTWDDGSVVVDERHDVVPAAGGARSEHVYRFRMRPWSVDELRSRLLGAGFTRLDVGPGVGRRRPDRLFVAARR